MSKFFDANVVHWPNGNTEHVPKSCMSSELDQSLRLRIDGVLAVIRAVGSSEVFDKIPDDDLEKTYYRSAINLLLLAERELMEILDC